MSDLSSANIVSRGFIIQIWFCWPILALIAWGQIVRSEPTKRLYDADKANVDAAIARVKEGNFSGVDVDMIGRGRAVEAIPILKKKFLSAQDTLDRATIARVLIKLGDKDDAYWNFLVKLATPALESDAPDFMNFESDGKTSKGPSPAFVAWAAARNVPPNGPNGTAAEDSMYTFPGRIILLGLTGDGRAIPLLRQALSSPNHMIEIAAAEGLAELQDKESIPLIIEACERAPAAAKSLIAESLVYLDDDDAQKAVDTYIPADRAKILRDAKAQGKKTPLTY
jgi:HEAT repeat protein